MISNFNDYLKKYKESVESPEKFWSSYAENFKWEKNGMIYWNGILEHQKLSGFENAKLNITTNCSRQTFKNIAKRLLISGFLMIQKKIPYLLLMSNFI